MEKLVGCFNESADRVKRVDVTWSDTNPEREFNEGAMFERLKCRNCEGTDFKVLSHVGHYRTLAQCSNCGMYYIAHYG